MTACWLAAIDRPCPRFGHETGRVDTGAGPHAARLSCARCGRYLMWISKAVLAALRERREAAIQADRGKIAEVPQ